MFGWFKGAKHEDPLIAARQLAQDAVINSVAEAGDYSAFFVRLCDDRPTAEQLKNHTALSAFVELIEERIRGRRRRHHGGPDRLAQSSPARPDGQ